MQVRDGQTWQTLREERGLTRAALARQVGCDPVTLWRLEHDRPVSALMRRRVKAALAATKPLETREAVAA